MEELGGTKFTWVIKNIHSYESCDSDRYEIGTTGCTCFLAAGPRENKPELLFVRLLISYDPSVPTKRRRYIKFRLTVVNQLWEELSVTEEGLHWFDLWTMEWGSDSEFFLPRFQYKDGGFLVNDEIKINVEVDALEVTDKLDMLDEWLSKTRTPSKVEENNSAVSCVLLKEASSTKESMDRPSQWQAESVRRLFGRHPDIAIWFRAKNPLLRKSCMTSLLILIETLCEPIPELSNEDLVEAEIALTYVKDSGFRVDWLEEKLVQAKKKKAKVMSGFEIVHLMVLLQKRTMLYVLAKEQKAELGGKKFTWVIKNIPSFGSKTCDSRSKKKITCVSDTFEIGTTGWNCRLSASSHTENPELFFVHLLIGCNPSVPTIRRRYVKFRVTVVNQLLEELSVMEEGLHWFDSLAMQWGSVTVFFLPGLRDKDGGFLVNDEIKIYAEVEVLQVLDKLDTPEEFEKTTMTPMTMEEVSCLLIKETSTIKESIDVNGFHVFPSQVESVNRLFERHPDIAVGFRAKNQLLRKSCMNSLLCLIETLTLQDIYTEDLAEAEIALTYVKDSGFRVDWLEKKLEQVKEKKKKELSGLAIVKETEESLMKLKLQCVSH